MSKFVSIKSKLVSRIMVMITVIFMVVLTVITILNVAYVNSNIRASQKSIWGSLVAKGRILVTNNSMAMTGMAEDNAFTAIQTLVASTVQDDEDIVYGIYMDNTNTPWVYATEENPTGAPQSFESLSDSVSLWVSGLTVTAEKEVMYGNSEIIEFAAPVLIDDEALGWIRYGFSTRSIEKSIEAATADGRRARNRTLGLLVLLCMVSLVSGYFITDRLASGIVKPIGSLVKSTKIISEGNYSFAVERESDDEVGNLAVHFESMRSTIKKYTDHLQDLIDEKMQQVNDILNNIDQGLFTINLDGTVNEEYSARANEILKVKDIASHKINELLRLDRKQQDAFYCWLNLIQRRHTTQKWKKLVKLAPVQELEIANADRDENEYVSVSYQRIYDNKGDLSKVMVLAMDETEKRMRELQMLAEKQKHSNEVRTILGIANTPPDEMGDFLDDSRARIKNLETLIDDHYEGASIQRQNYPQGSDYVITEEQVNVLYRDIHTIKGNAGSYGFELLSSHAHNAEDILENLREPVSIRRLDTLKNLRTQIVNIRGEMDAICEKIQLVFGKDEETSVRIPEGRVTSIQTICQQLDPQVRTEEVDKLISECMMLSWKPLKTLTRKYQKAIQKAARKTNKNIEFRCDDELSLYAPGELYDIDDVLLHLVRNCVDHGIETPEVREELGKGIGRVVFGYAKKEGLRRVVVSDDGKGIDPDRLVEICLEKGIVSSAELAEMSEKDKVMLIFRPGFSTAESISDISGRGMGMNIVMDTVTQLGGNISVETQLGKGSSFIVEIPEQNVAHLKSKEDSRGV